MTKKSRRLLLTVWSCRCERCGHAWESTGPKAPAACAGCKSRYWDTPRGVLKRGRKTKS